MRRAPMNRSRTRRPRADFAASFDDLVKRLTTDLLAATRSEGRGPPPGPRVGALPKTGHLIRRLKTLEHAVQWQLELVTGQVHSRAEIARREGVTRAAVTQTLRLLKPFFPADGRLVDADRTASHRANPKSNGRAHVRGYQEVRKDMLRRFERNYVMDALRAAGGNISEGARLAKVDRKHMWRLIRRNDISPGPQRHR